MRSREPVAAMVVFLAAVFVSLVAVAALVWTSWTSLTAERLPAAAPVDRTYWLAFLCVVAAAAVTLKAARRLRDAVRVARDEDPILWI